MGPDAVYMTPPPSVQYSDAQWVSMGVTLCSPVLDLSPSYLPPPTSSFAPPPSPGSGPPALT